MIKVNNISQIDLDSYVNDVVNSWDMETLISFATNSLLDFCKVTPPEQLVEEYNDFYNLSYGSEDDLEDENQ